MNDWLRGLPKIDRLMAHPDLAEVPLPARVAAARQVIDEVRQAILTGTLDAPPQVVPAVLERARVLVHGRMRRVINATGVVLHTNLGRAQWSERARAAANAAMGASNVELDLQANRRGGRLDGLRWLMAALVGAEDALVVNNCAAAVLLGLTAIARGHEVVVSRGEMVEIGGSFRVPDVIASGGATLVGVGTTNRTRVADFVAATGEHTAAWLRVHPSNFRIEGFTEAPDPRGLAQAAREASVVLIEDLGSGSLDGALGERTVRQALEDGAELVMFSGDKLLGGPQAGLVVGTRERVQQLRLHPLYRALRVDKVIQAALEATLTDHLLGELTPVSASLAAVDPARVERVAEAVGGEVIEAAGRAGGGTLPELDLPERAVLLRDVREEGARALRVGATPVLGRLTADGLVLSLRAVAPGDDELLVEAVLATRR